MLVLCSGLTHAIWNLFTKRSRNKTVFLWSIHIAAFVLLLPSFVMELSAASISLRGYGFIGLSMLFQMGYGLLLPLAYRKGDISQVYPIMRGTGALCVPIFSVFLYKETITWVGWVGIGCIVLGMFAISGFFRSVPAQATRLNLWPALAVGACITGYVLTDKIVLQHISPLALIELGNLAYLIILTPAALRTGEIRAEWRINRMTIALGTVLSPGSYWLFLLAVKLAPLSHLAPMREMGTVFATLLGVLLLKERQGLRRVMLSALITTGVILMGLWGSP
ncbi:DMT family transporter [Paenibacillus sp. HJGM_3]|uniref:DMT family transporter n=1 Tax=Paenibacillus sp. HJGM_3 TaxID=3379816 RepID=UPI003858CBF6